MGIFYWRNMVYPPTVCASGGHKVTRPQGHKENNNCVCDTTMIWSSCITFSLTISMVLNTFCMELALGLHVIYWCLCACSYRYEALFYTALALVLLSWIVVESVVSHTISPSLTLVSKKSNSLYMVEPSSMRLPKVALHSVELQHTRVGLCFVSYFPSDLFFLVMLKDKFPRVYEIIGICNAHCGRFTWSTKQFYGFGSLYWSMLHFLEPETWPVWLALKSRQCIDSSLYSMWVKYPLTSFFVLS